MKERLRQPPEKKLVDPSSRFIAVSPKPFLGKRIGTYLVPSESVVLVISCDTNIELDRSHDISHCWQCRSAESRRQRNHNVHQHFRRQLSFLHHLGPPHSHHTHTRSPWDVKLQKCIHRKPACHCLPPLRHPRYRAFYAQFILRDKRRSRFTDCAVILLGCLLVNGDLVWHLRWTGCRIGGICCCHWWVLRRLERRLEVTTFGHLGKIFCQCFLRRRSCRVLNLQRPCGSDHLVSIYD